MNNYELAKSKKSLEKSKIIITISLINFARIYSNDFSGHFVRICYGIFLKFFFPDSSTCHMNSPKISPKIPLEVSLDFFQRLF